MLGPHNLLLLFFPQVYLKVEKITDTCGECSGVEWVGGEIWERRKCFCLPLCGSGREEITPFALSVFLHPNKQNCFMILPQFPGEGKLIWRRGHLVDNAGKIYKSRSVASSS